MHVEHLTYSQYEGTDQHWSVDIPLQPTTLLVGKNAVGKSRTLNVITGLARLISGDRKLVHEGSWTIGFCDGTSHYKYALTVKEARVVHESLYSGDQEYFSREASGKGSIKGETTRHDFEIPGNYLAVAVKRDLKQHPFLEPIFKWASRLRYYDFGTEMGRRHIGIINESAAAELDPGDADQVVGIFRRGIKDFGAPFRDAIRGDMSQIGYDLEEVGVANVPNLLPNVPIAGDIVGLFAKERDLPIKTWQVPDMSRGMFRALSCIVLAEYSFFSRSADAFLIDDAGEGLDLTRAGGLVRLLIERSATMNAQMILASNDRYIINSVSIESISALRREGGRVSAMSTTTHPDVFRKLRAAGLSTTDLVAADFILD